MQFELGIFLVELLVLIASIKLIFPLLILKKNKDISVADFLNYVSLLIGTLVVGGCLTGFILEPAITYVPALVALMALTGSFLFYRVKKNPKLSVLATIIFCFFGVFLLPNSAHVQDFTCVAVLSKIVAICFWTLFIFMMQKLDRVPFFSFSAFSALMIIIAFMCSPFFMLFDPSFSILCFSTLGLFGVSSLILKKQNVMWFGSTLSFFLAYLSGYFGVYLGALGYAKIIPIFIAFPLMEIILAFSINFIKEKKFLPLTTPFLIEKAYTTGKHVTKAVKKLFWTCFFFAGLGFVFIYIAGKNSGLDSQNHLLVILIVTAILLLNSYIVFSSWGQEKKEFKNLFKDIKTELNSLSKEINETKQKASTKKKKK